ncbi:MAG: translation initiation factor [Bacteroidales bacterium]|nr:translation initiation factor [Bacteroidales bacterium]
MSAKKRPSGIIYSTNPDFNYNFGEGSEQQTLPPSEQDLRVHVQSLKGNKKLTLIRGFVGSEDDMKALGRKLKSACGVGGSVKDGEIFIQGDKREQIMLLLQEYGYKAKRSGG